MLLPFQGDIAAVHITQGDALGLVLLPFQGAFWVLWFLCFAFGL